MALDPYKKQHFGEEKLQRLQDNLESFLRQLYSYTRYPIGLDDIRVPKAGFYVGSDSLTKIIVPGSKALNSCFQLKNKIYKIKEDLICDISTTGVNALDTGTIAAATCYYVYAVIHKRVVGIVASTRSPLDGPLDYPHWTYLGSCATKAGTANFSPFQCYGGEMLSDDTIESNSHTGDTTVTQQTYSSLPITAKFAYVQLQVVGTVTNTAARAGGTNSVTNPNSVATTLQVISINNQHHGKVPIVEPNKIYLKVEHASNTATCNLLGWDERPLDYQ